MSIQTLRKRIAVVAALALGAGVMSVSPANAGAGTLGNLTLSAGTGVICYQDATAATKATIVTGTSVVVVPAASSYFVLSGGGVMTASTETTGTDSSISNGGLTFTSSSDALTLTTRFNTPGTWTIKGYADSTSTAALDTITVTVVGACSTSTFSATYTEYETIATTADTSPDGETGSTYSFNDEQTAKISIAARNVYGSTVPSGTWLISATNGALVGISTSDTSVGLTSVASQAGAGSADDTSAALTDSTTADAGIFAAVAQSVEGTALNTVVTITYNGVEVYKKTLLFKGDLASITVSGVDVQAVGGSTLTGIYDVLAKDAAGNLLSWSVSGDATKYNAQVTYLNGGTTTITGTGALATAADAYWTCAATSGKASVRLKGTTNAGTTVYSNDFEALCGSAAFTYTASLDKASYLPGDIATLTISAKDASGFAPFKNETVDASAGTPSIAGSQMSPVNTPTSADVFNAVGVKTYTFTVGSIAGKYNMAVNLGYTGNSAISIPYTITGGGTTNEDVLKSIVALIASINKQIQALQKLILKR
jgi:hypothetical protein